MNWREILVWQTVKMLEVVGTNGSVAAARALERVEIPEMDGGGFKLFPPGTGSQSFQKFSPDLINVLAGRYELHEGEFIDLAVPVMIKVTTIPAVSFRGISPWGLER